MSGEARCLAAREVFGSGTDGASAGRGPGSPVGRVGDLPRQRRRPRGLLPRGRRVGQHCERVGHLPDGSAAEAGTGGSVGGGSTDRSAPVAAAGMSTADHPSRSVLMAGKGRAITVVLSGPSKSLMCPVWQSWQPARPIESGIDPTRWQASSDIGASGSPPGRVCSMAEGRGGLGAVLRIAGRGRPGRWPDPAGRARVEGAGIREPP